MIHIKIYVGNLDYAVEDRDLREIFERAGCDVLEGHIFSTATVAAAASARCA